MPAPAALNEGMIAGQSINGSGATYDMVGQGVGTPASPDTRIWVGGDSTLVVQADMTGAAVGDLGVQVNAYEADNATINPQPLPVVQQPTTNPALAGGHVYFYAQYDVTGVEMVRIRLTNNNAGVQTITRASWRLE